MIIKTAVLEEFSAKRPGSQMPSVHTRMLHLHLTPDTSHLTPLYYLIPAIQLLIGFASTIRRTPTTTGMKVIRRYIAGH